GTGLVGAQVVVQATAARADVRDPEADAPYLALHAQIELVDCSVARLQRVAAHVLRGYGGADDVRGERVRKTEQRLSGGDSIVVGFGDLERTAAGCPVEVVDAVRECAVAAADHQVL